MTAPLYFENLNKTRKASYTATWARFTDTQTRVIQAILNEFLCKIISSLLFLYSSALKIEAVMSYETLVNLYRTTRRHISEYYIAGNTQL